MEILVGEDRWKYTLYGKGANILVAFHGYGQDAGVLRHLAKGLGEEYRFVAIDLAYHGENSAWRENFTFDEHYAQDWLNAVLSHFQCHSIALLGYSIGARIALFIASCRPERIRELWLLAPDGLPVSLAYRFLTSTWVGLFIFRRFVGRPGLARFLVYLGLRCRVFSKKTGNFYLKEMETSQKRRQLYNTWIAYRSALPDRKVLFEANRSGQLAVTGVLGRTDVVIPFRKTLRRMRAVFPELALLELDLGHNLLSEKAARVLVERIGNKKSDHRSL